MYPALATLWAVTDAIAPARCLKCLLAGTWLCPLCRLALADLRYPQSCAVCKRPQARGLTCSACRSGCALTGLLSLSSYRTVWLRRGIHWLKFKGIRSCAVDLADLLVAKLNVIAPRPQLIDQAELIPIPLHRGRLRQRGFNQSELLAQYLSSLTGIRKSSRLLRQRATAPQAQLPTDLRQANMTNAFALADEARGHNSIAIIIDDVATSGATLGAAARVVRQAGYQQVWGLTLARG